MVSGFTIYLTILYICFRKFHSHLPYRVATMSSVAFTDGLLLLAAMTVSVVFVNKDGFMDLNPADVEAKPRVPYALLSLPTKNDSVAVGPTSEQCYKTDYGAGLALYPKYRQMTNNYKHKNGESCSAPNHDLILGMYA